MSFEPMVMTEVARERWYDLVMETRYQHDGGKIYHACWKIGGDFQVEHTQNGNMWNVASALEDLGAGMGTNHNTYLLISNHMLGDLSKSDFEDRSVSIHLHFMRATMTHTILVVQHILRRQSISLITIMPKL